MIKEDELIIKYRDQIAILTLNRPEVHNAINMSMRAQLEKIWDDFYQNNEVRVVLITGKGKSFCAGVDLKERINMTPKQVSQLRERGPIIQSKIINLPKPVIAAVNGNALAGGCEITLACDIRIASENATFGLPEINLGIIPGGGGTQLLPRIVGDAIAREIIFTGKKIDASEALRIGLVNQVVSNSELLEKSIQFAANLVQKSPTSLKNAKKSINRWRETGLSEGFQFEAQAYLNCIPSKDRIEALKAFSEKRTPIFTGD
jgi:enoyl-CoA hydratase